jgi:hypothetical protein
LLLSVVACGRWLPVWLLMVAFGGERRAAVSVDPTGGVHRQQAPMEAHRILVIVAAVIWGLVLLFVFTSCVSAFAGDHHSGHTSSAVL